MAIAVRIDLETIGYGVEGRIAVPSCSSLGIVEKSVAMEA